jgi:hypothetical protein
VNPIVKNQKEDVPLAHYLALYRDLDPLETARRTGLLYDAGTENFALCLMGTEYRIAFPLFKALPPSGAPELSPYEEILLLRYLCTGRHMESLGKQLSYNEIPWGKVYYRNFEGRCLKRLAQTFGNDLESLRRVMENWASLEALPLKQGDAGYRFKFMNGLFISIMLWAGDDEFPPSAQMLFDDNFVSAFSAEDLAVVGEIVINRLKLRKSC